MKNAKITLLLIVACSYNVMGQMRVIKGRIVDQELFPSRGVHVLTKDSVMLGETDNEGMFLVVIPQRNQTLLFLGLAMEWASIELNDNCDMVEIVMLDAWHLDFMSIAKMNRHRLKEFRKIAELHTEAFRRGHFLKENACYSRSFEPYKRIRK